MRGSQNINRSRGFTLVESMMAMLVFVAGSMSLIPLLVWGITLQANSRNASRAHSLARAQIEEFRAMPTTDAELAVGGSLTADVADHFDQPAGTPFTRRWVVAAGAPGSVRGARRDPGSYREPCPYSLRGFPP